MSDKGESSANTISCYECRDRGYIRRGMYYRPKFVCPACGGKPEKLRLTDQQRKDRP